MSFSVIAAFVISGMLNAGPVRITAFTQTHHLILSGSGAVNERSGRVNRPPLIDALQNEFRLIDGVLDGRYLRRTGTI
jgi:hypothetical protein